MGSLLRKLGKVEIERITLFCERKPLGFIVIEAVVQRGPLKARCRNQFLCVRNILARSCQNPDLACALRPQPVALELVVPVCSLHTDSGIVSSLILKNCGEYGCSMSERKHHSVRRKHHSARLSSKHELV